MTEQNEDVKVEQPQGETPEKKIEEKLFNQKEVDSLIQNRLKREKDVFSTTQTTWNTEKENYENTIKKYEDNLKSMIATQAEGLSVTEKALLAKLSVQDQLDFLANMPKTEKRIPITPKSNGEDTQTERKLKKFL